MANFNLIFSKIKVPAPIYRLNNLTKTNCSATTKLNNKNQYFHAMKSDYKNAIQLLNILFQTTVILFHQR